MQFLRSRHSSPTQATPIDYSNRRNVLIVGDVGVGKSSLVNLISGEERTKTSDSAKSCTLQSQEHIIHLNNVQFALHDTAGMHEAKGHMKTSEYLDAVYQAFLLISKLEQSGGISLLVFCMKGGRISITSQQTYSLFVDVFCRRKVPVVIAVTHLETHEPMEKWWSENEQHIKEYGFRSLAHACITATRGYKNAFSEQYEESKRIIHDLLFKYSDQVTWKEEKKNWFKRFAVRMGSWLSPGHEGQLDQKHLKRKLTKKCGFSSEEADLIAKKMGQVQTTGDVPDEDGFVEMQGGKRKDAEKDATPLKRLDEDKVEDANRRNRPQSDQNGVVLDGDNESKNFKEPRISGTLEENEDGVESGGRDCAHSGTGVEVTNQREGQVSAPVAPHGDLEVRLPIGEMVGRGLIESGRKHAAKSTLPRPVTSGRLRKIGTTLGGEHASMSKFPVADERWRATPIRTV